MLNLPFNPVKSKLNFRSTNSLHLSFRDNQHHSSPNNAPCQSLILTNKKTVGPSQSSPNALFWVHAKNDSPILQMHTATPPIQHIYEQHPLRLLSPSTTKWHYLIPDHSISTAYPTNPSPMLQTAQAYQTKEPPTRQQIYTPHPQQPPLLSPSQ